MARKNLKKHYPIQFCFTLEIIRVLSRLTVKNFIRNQTVLKKKRTYTQKDQKTEGDMLLTFSVVIQKIIVQNFTKKELNSSQKIEEDILSPKVFQNGFQQKGSCSDKVFIKR